MHPAAGQVEMSGTHVFASHFCPDGHPQSVQQVFWSSPGSQLFEPHTGPSGTQFKLPVSQCVPHSEHPHTMHPSAGHCGVIGQSEAQLVLFSPASQMRLLLQGSGGQQHSNPFTEAI
jgi:hypothetical protein